MLTKLPVKTIIYIQQVKQVINLLVLFVVVSMGCKTKNNQNLQTLESIPSIDTLIDQASKRGNGNALKSIQFLDSAIAYKNFSLKEKIRVFGYHSYVYNYYLNNFEKAQLYADSMLIILMKEDMETYPKEFANAYFTNGDLLYRKKKYTEAYAFYYKARQIGNAYYDACTKSEYSYRIGLILYRQLRFTESKNNFIQSFNESQTCDSLDFSKYFRKQELLNAIALCFLKTNLTDSANYYFNEALNFIDKNKKYFPEKAAYHDIANGVIYGNLGDVLRAKGKHAEAARMFNKSIEINLKSGYDIKDAQLSYLKLSDLWFAENKLDSTQNALTAIKKSLDTTPNPKAEVEWYKQMWLYFDKQNNTTEAYNYLKRFIEKNENYENSLKSINEIDIDKQIAFFDKQNELQLLQNENQIKQLYLIVTVIIGLFLVVIAILLWLNGNKSKKNIKQLQILNTTINAQNEQLEVALEKLEESSKEKDRILKMVAHDLRTPVASIMSLANLVDEEKDELAKKEMLEIIKQACNNSLNLISEILAAARKEISESEKEKTSINSFIKECISLLQIKASEKNQQLVFQPSQQLVNVAINKEKFIRVINNLVTNAVKFSHANTAVTISTVVKPANHAVVIAVKDTGIGIPDKLKDKVFDMLTDAKRFGTNGEQPFGLGLSITKQIVEAHGGKIWFQSEVNAGTIFYIELPVVD